jgi:nicotinamidase-related amidase
MPSDIPLITSRLPGTREDSVGESLPATVVDRASTALMIIDMQYYDAHRHFGLGARGKEKGLTAETEYYFSRLETLTVPAIQELLAACRETGIPVLHGRVMNLAADSSDTSRRYKAKGMFIPPGSKDSEILEELAPLPGEIVINKTTSSVFVSTNADFMLRNMGVDTLIVTGVTTNNCVESCVRGASDLGYNVLLVDEGCATWSQEKHDFALRHLDRNFAIVKSLEQVLGEIGAGAAVQAGRS